jgi:hypothetical protein
MKKIIKFKEKMDKLTQKLENEMYGICETLKYHDSSRFSYNIDRIRMLNKKIQEFEILEK